MKTTLLLGAGIGLCAAMAWAAKDPVIMTVNGVDVPKSEFEYLYHKNSQQQITAQPIDEYLDMFINYRLKVAEAKEEGLDTTAAFRQEMAQYRHDLAAPYLVDSVYLNQLVKEGYERSKEEVDVSHIMLFKQASSAENKKSKEILDSLRNQLLQGADFADLAARYSMDRGTSKRGGSLGYISHGRYPYQFEVTSYSLKPGEISEITESPMAYHIIKSNGRRPAKGTVHAAHILLLDRDGNDAAASAAVKERIDSIYNVLTADPDKFEKLAAELSQDPGSARQGGMLPWFGSGQMVQEFEDVAFETPVGAISKPFRSAFGWHILRKYDAKGVPGIEEIKDAEISRLQSPQDYSYLLIKRNQNAKLSKKHKAVVNEPTLEAIRAKVMVNGLDSAFYLADAKLDNAEILKVGNKRYVAADFVAELNDAILADKGNALDHINNSFEGFLNRRLIDAEEEWLAANNEDYRNLYNEYCNGSMLYEASVKNVWDKAAKDTEGLQAFFNSHRDEYKWKEPRAKGILVQAKNDTVAAEIAQRYLELPKNEALSTLRKEFKGVASFDRVLTQKGSNAMIDNLLFGGEEVKPSNSKYNTYFMLDGRTVAAPEDMEDVKGQVTSDYQEALEEEWLGRLRAKYPVVVNRKVLKKVK